MEPFCHNHVSPADVGSQEAKTASALTLHALFEEQVKKTPDHVALIFEEQHMTYRELNSKANQLAHYLRKQEVVPDQLMGICLHRSCEMIIAILAVLKAGGAYMPIDPVYPKKRMDYMLQDSQCRILLTTRDLCDFSGRTIFLDDSNFFAFESAENPIPIAEPHHLAYVIYTSGSTGQPKGVMIEHRAIVNTIMNQALLFSLKKDSRVLLFASFGFDAFISELFSTLSTGGTIVLVHQNVQLANADVLQKYHITHITAFPSFLSMLPKQDLPDLSVIISAGEPCSEALVNQWAPGRRFLNGYGPTEIAICATMKECQAYIGKPTIGYPIKNVTTYVVSESGELVAEGKIGELYIGGAGVARGYLNRPELTAEKFISNPFGLGRVYKTGDLVRLLPKGELDFVGRKDNQVKVRGFRVELEEVEHAIQSITGIKQAAVLYHQHRLIAYVAPKTVSIEVIRTQLKQQLPDYMIPSRWITLKTLPVTINHKIDRQKLLALLKSPAAVTSKNPLKHIWCELLDIAETEVTPHISFFSLGGHSLLVPVLQTRIRATWGVDLSPADIFEHETFQQLWKYIQSAPQYKKQAIPISTQSVFPLSPYQEQIGLHQQVAGDVPLFNETANIRFNEAISAVCLEGALQLLIERHAIFRICIKNNQQMIQEDRPFSLSFIDLDGLPPDERLRKAIELATKEAKKPFDLESDPFYRFLLVKIAEKHYRLFMTFHHLVMDGETMNLLVKDLFDLYHQQPISELPYRYVDYAVWLKHQTIKETDLQFWQEQLREVPALHISPKSQTEMNFIGKRQCLKLPNEMTERVKAYSKQEGVTLFAFLFTVFQVLLYRYSNQTDFAVGTVVSCRDAPIFGNFLNTLMIRSDLSNHPNFQALLQHTWAQLKRCYVHQAVPFTEVLKTIKRTKLPFSVSFVLEPKVEEVNWPLSQLEVHTGTTKYDLTFELDERKEGIIGRVEYRTDLFDDDFIQRMMGHYRQLIDSILKNPTESIDRLNLLTEKEKHQLLVEFNDTAAPYPKDKTIHQLFEEQVEKTPNHVAVIFEDKQLTYRELNEKANQLAHYLRRRGVEPDRLVGICLHRSFEMIIGILGILKAGGAYLPMDPDHPQKRIDFMAKNCVCMLTKDVTLTFPVERIDLSCWNLFDKESIQNPIHITEPHHLVYVIYTSGSTGEPKGVMIEHQSLCNQLCWLFDEFNFHTRDVLLQKTSYIFDASIWELFLPIVFGFKLVIAAQNIFESNDRLIKLIKKHKITTLQLVPSLLLKLLTDVEVSAFVSLQRIFSGGEVLTANLVDLFHRSFKTCRLYNLYGPTEATINTTSFFYPTNRVNEKTSIGKPVANMALYVLGSNCRLLPSAIIGELYIGGISLARGYLNRSDLTAEKFIPNPFGEGRLYKTGDLVRWLPDGNLEFIGRIDDQVKIRGYRVECGEVESALLGFSTIRQAVVLVRDVGENGLSLIAYLVLETKTSFDFALLRRFLKEQLPDYMMPSYFVVLDDLPLLSNGKLNKKALPLPADIDRPEQALPRTNTEKQLAEHWSKVLGVKQIGQQSDFFELGGHSLSALQVISLIQSTWQVSVSLKDFFRLSTLSSISSHIDQCGRLSFAQFNLCAIRLRQSEKSA
ncbi:MAG: amino acid adenylation domain-containing protein [Pseudomonadota bacterium]